MEGACTESLPIVGTNTGGVNDAEAHARASQVSRVMAVAELLEVASEAAPGISPAAVSRSTDEKDCSTLVRREASEMLRVAARALAREESAEAEHAGGSEATCQRERSLLTTYWSEST